MLTRLYPRLFIRITFFIYFFNIFLYSQNIKITGDIKNVLDKPVKKAVITLRNLKDEIIKEEISDRKGEFIIEDIDPKFYYLIVDHETEGLQRIKINPRKNKNEDLYLNFILDGNDKPVICYLFGDEPSTTFDPILNFKEIKIETEPEHIILTWRDINQAKLYTLFENGKEVYVGEKNRFEKDLQPGVEFCYTIKASGSHGLEGEVSSSFCASVPTKMPRDIVANEYKNQITLSWSKINGAKTYRIYRDDEKVGEVSVETYEEFDLEFSTEYYYKISAVDAMGKESLPSVEIKSNTHKFVEIPILSSMNSKTNIALIWNEVEEAVSYNVYRNNEKIESTTGTSYTDPLPPGKEYCYRVSCLDQYDIETDLSNEHCTKVPLSPPNGLIADADVISMHLNWDEVIGADYYMIYERIDQDSIRYIGESKSIQFTVTPLDFSADLCFVVTSVDMDGLESDFSLPACNVVLDPPHFTIQNMVVNEPSGNGMIDALEGGTLQFSIFNDGQSPANQVIASVIPKDPNQFLLIGEPFVIDTLQAGRIKYANIDIEGKLQLETGEYECELKLSSRENVSLEESYVFNVQAKSMIPPKLIIADFSISNDFGTQYIPKNEVVGVTIRVQNVGEGRTDMVSVLIKENRTFTTPDFNGMVTLPSFKPGDYMDIEIPVMTSVDNFAIDVQLTDYLDRIATQRINLETMRNYRSPMEMTIRDIGAEEIVYYPDELGETDVDRLIPLGRKNQNGIALIIGTQYYEDKRYGYLEYADRDKNVIRKYFSQAFGLSDFQMLPSKPWQMENGPKGDEYQLIFDPNQGDLKKRILSAEKYSNIEKLDIFVYYRGYGEWVNGKPLLIPKDAKYDRHITKYPLEELVRNLSRISVLNSVNTITLFMDVTYINPENSSGLIWDYPKLSDKISILSSSSNGETSQLYHDKKHSFFTYSLLKGLSGNSDDGDGIINLGEVAEYVYKNIPEEIRKQPGAIVQNPTFNGTDLKRIVLDLR